jgi:hypothetical protein
VNETPGDEDDYEDQWCRSGRSATGHQPGSRFDSSPWSSQT